MLIPGKREKIKFVEPLKPSKAEIVKKISGKIFNILKENPAKTAITAMIIFSLLNLFPHENTNSKTSSTTNTTKTIISSPNQQKIINTTPIHRKDIHSYIYSLFSKYQQNNQNIPLNDLQQISDLFFQNFATEYWFSGKTTHKIVEKGLTNYRKYKVTRENIFVKELWPIVGEENAKKLVLIGFVESYFGVQNNNKVAKGPFQLTPSTSKKYGLIKNGKDYRNYPILSAQAAAKHLKDIFLRWEKLHGKITSDTIWLALADYNGGIINHLKNYPETIEKYTTTLKNIYLDYNWIITQYSKGKINYKTLKQKKKEIDTKYFKGEYSLLTLNFKKGTSKKTKIKYWKNRLNLVIIQQLKYPWKLEGAWKFIQNYNKKYVLKKHTN